MNKLAIIFLLGATPLFPLLAQQQTDPQKVRTIEVTGSAEMEISPDEIYLSVTLKEFTRDKVKVTLDEVDKQFRKTLDELKIDMKDVTLESANAYYDWDYWKGRPGEFFASKTYLIKLSDLAKYNQLMSKMDSKGIQNAYLQRTDHSKIEEYRKQVKVQALKAAKEKAQLLLESIGEHAGEVIFIREINQGNYYPMMYKGASNMAMDASSSGGMQDAGMQKIKLRYEVEAHFVIQ
jgi:uncharacterized protein YggE